MRLSSSLARNVIETLRGGVFNKFRIKRRRDALFFEDILAEYLKECEREGYAEEIEKNNYDSFAMLIDNLLPGAMRSLPPGLIFNNVLRDVWVNIGLIDDMHADIRGDKVVFRMKNECITRLIGANRYSVGGIAGLIKSIFRCEVKSISVKKLGENEWEYEFLLERGKYRPVKVKDYADYERLNRLKESGGVNLKRAMGAGVFRIEQNRIFFRSMPLWHVESVFLHTLGNLGLCKGALPRIAYSKFKNVVEKGSSAKERLVLLKTLLESMGWGTVQINFRDKNNIAIEIREPPYGIQAEPENWSMFLLTILGYLWTINKKLRLKKTVVGERLLRATYAE